TLIAQTSQEMLTDAQTHTQLIDDYFSQQLLETDALSRLQPIQQFLAGDRSDATRAQALVSLTSGRSRGSYYEDWSLLDLKGQPQLYYPTAPVRHGQFYISPSDLQSFNPSNVQQIQARSSLISNVFYNQVTNEAYIDIYAPVFSANYQLVGILRATFDLHYIWNIVNQEAGANGKGSYALIFDQYGVCIAQTNPDTSELFPQTNASSLFKAVTLLSADMQQRVNANGLYGVSPTGSMPVLNQGPQLATVLQNSASTFQVVPPGAQTTFQGAKSVASSVHWTYLVVSPLNNVTAVADDQLRLTSIITVAIAILAAVIGLGIGRRITQPILRAVERLRYNSQALKALADKEQSAATQQTWVVDSSQVGLRTVQYYTKASDMALQRVNDVGTSLVKHWHQVDPAAAKRAVEQLVGDAKYAEKAIHYQDESNKKLESTIKVTIQVADQLATGATSATDAAEQLEHVVGQLEQVIGR
ncbi:MAG TPA: cache domain-containing protein, partial [Ktedonobacteraceae bacterium]|nr:cache domain-containing protein [Ktedonobacteraceae bacterium]